MESRVIAAGAAVCVYQAEYIGNKCEIKLFNASECCRFLRIFSSVIAPSLVKMKWVRC